MSGTRCREWLHPIWFMAMILSSTLLENILLVCGLSAVYFNLQRHCECKIKSRNRWSLEISLSCTSYVQEEVAGVTSIKATPHVAFWNNQCCFSSDNIYSFTIYIAPIIFIGNFILFLDQTTLLIYMLFKSWSFQSCDGNHLSTKTCKHNFTVKMFSIRPLAV